LTTGRVPEGKLRTSAPSAALKAARLGDIFRSCSTTGQLSKGETHAIN
jgi:hypothetical protein